MKTLGFKLSWLFNALCEANISEALELYLSHLKEWVSYDALSVMLKAGDVLKVVYSEGLAEQAHLQTYELANHPRLNAIMESSEAISFPFDSVLPDPFDGFLIHDKDALHRMHSCWGSVLKTPIGTQGCITLDSLNKAGFKGLSQQRILELCEGVATLISFFELKNQRDFERSKNEHWAKEILGMSPKRNLLGESQSTLQLKQRIQQIAKTPFPVLILGETGTGKELVAREIHSSSELFDKPLITINCAALPESVAESELFGHVKGAFTGADRTRLGKFELADGATLFLDEIGDLSLNLQAKILRALQEGEIQPIGSDTIKRVNVRVIAATHQPLEEKVEKREFRRDLWHRLSVFPLTLKPLRERPQDIKDLAIHFVNEICGELKVPVMRLSFDVFKMLESMYWSGNVRELQNVLKASIVVAQPWEKSRKILKVEHIEEALSQYGRANTQMRLSEQIGSVSEGPIESEQISLSEKLEAFKKSELQKALKQAKGNQAQAARLLGLNRGNLHRMLKTFKLI